MNPWQEVLCVMYSLKPWSLQADYATRSCGMRSHWRTLSSLTWLLAKLNSGRAYQNSYHTKRKLRVFSHLLSLAWIPRTLVWAKLKQKMWKVQQIKVQTINLQLWSWVKKYQPASLYPDHTKPPFDLFSICSHFETNGLKAEEDRAIKKGEKKGESSRRNKNESRKNKRKVFSCNLAEESLRKK